MKSLSSLIIIIFFSLFSPIFGQEAENPDQPAYKSLPEPEPEGKAARLIIFTDKTCEECQEFKEKIFPKLLKKYPGNISSRIYHINRAANFLLLTRFEDAYGVAENDVPIIFIDGKVRSGLKEEIKKHLEDDIKSALEKGGAPWPEPKPEEKDISREDAIKERLESIALVPIILAGLADGINPCAFTTIIFLISYLSVIGRNRRQILITGVIYTTAVFLTYLALGFGLLNIVQKLVNISYVSRIIYALTALASLVVSVLSFRDYRLAKKGRFKDMTLKLSEDMQKRIHKSIHSKIKSLGTVSAALILGILVAMFELPCTGQVYLPIVTALSFPELRSMALPYLLVYNLMFIIPLIVVFIVAYLGVSSNIIGERFKNNVAVIKLIMGCVFMILTALLIFMTFS